MPPSRLYRMLSWLWALVIVSGALPAGGVQQAFLPDGNRIGTAVSNSPVSSDDGVLWLYVVQKGRLRKMGVQIASLAHFPVLDIDGYVNGMVLLSTTPMTVSLDKTPVIPIEITPDGYYDLKYFRHLSPEDFRSTFLSNENEITPAGEIQGRYCRFARVPGDALSTAGEFQLHMDKQGVQLHVTVRQTPPVRLRPLHSPALAADSPVFCYLGGAPDRLSPAERDVDDRLQNMAAGIQEIQAAFGTGLVGQVRILDYQDQYNAYTCADEDKIWLYSNLFWEEPAGELKTITEHETLHILSDRLGLPVSIPIRVVFAQLKGYGDSDQDWVITSGRCPATESPSRASPLFDVINERNWVPGARGGHAQDNLDEFCASFLHSLMYIKRFARILQEPIKLKDGTRVELSATEINQVAEAYLRVLDTIITVTQGQSPVQWQDFLTTCRNRLCTSLQAHILQNHYSGTATAVD